MDAITEQREERTGVSPAGGPRSRLEKVVYIGSVGYSGSTLLDMLLGRSDYITSLGEVHSLAKAAKRNSRCTCGSPIGACGFWKTVEARLAAATGRPTLQLSEFPLAPDLRKQSLHRRLPTMADLLLILGNRGGWKAGAAVSANAREYVDSARRALALYRAVAEVQGTPVVIDSSKDPLPLKALYLAAPELVRVVYLVRDGRAVSLSLAKRHGLSFPEAARRWVRFNWNLQLVMKTIPRRDLLFVRYEDLCTETASALERLGNFLGATVPPLDTPLRKTEFHNVGGNPMRFRRRETEIVLDEKWRAELDQGELQEFRRIGGRMNHGFGYT